MTSSDDSRRSASRRIATLDAGNGALKAALWSWPPGARDGGAAAVQPGARSGAAQWRALEPLEVVRGGWTEAHLETALDQLLAAADLALVSCVAGAARRSALDERLVRANVTDATAPHGLDLGACRQVATIGADRLWAARGAVALTDGAACLVVDAGTAVTVDAVGAATPAAPAGAFLGGAIALGTRPSARALAGEGADLFAVDVPPSAAGVPALGRESAEALRAGVVHGVRGAVRELAGAVAREAGLADDAPRLVTGGDAEFVLLDPPCVPEPVHVPLLVHLGLLAAWCADGARG